MEGLQNTYTLEKKNSKTNTNNMEGKTWNEVIK